MSAAQATVLELSGVKGGDRPSIIFFYSKQTELKGKKDRPTKQSEDSGRVASLLFQDEGSSGIGMAAKHFNRVEVDVSDVTRRQNPITNQERAPMVVVTLKSGRIVSALTGKGQLTQKALLGAMLRTLVASGYKTAAKDIRILTGLHDEATEIAGDMVLGGFELEDKRKKLGTIKSRSKGTRSDEQKIAKAEATVSELEAKLKELGDRKQEIATLEAKYSNGLSGGGTQDNRDISVGKYRTGG